MTRISRITLYFLPEKLILRDAGRLGSDQAGSPNISMLPLETGRFGALNVPFEGQKVASKESIAYLQVSHKGDAMITPDLASSVFARSLSWTHLAYPP